MTHTPSGARAMVALPADDQILITREFAAPRHLVFRAWTTPELVLRWWSGRRGPMTSCEIDLRVGGLWRYVMVNRNGHEIAFRGEFREIVPDERIVSTEVFEAMPDGEALNTITFTETGGRTTLALLMQLDGREARDGIIASGMEGGMQESMDLLEETVRSLQQG